MKVADGFWFTIFLCWVVYYLAMILKRVFTIMETLAQTLEAIESFFSKAKEKVNSVGTTLTTLVNVGKRTFDFIQERKTKKSARQKTT